MMELAELFQDMDNLVVQQEAAVVNIEMKGEEVVENMDKGTEQIGVAIQSARNARKWKWWCLGIVGKFLYTFLENSANVNSPHYCYYRCRCPHLQVRYPDTSQDYNHSSQAMGTFRLHPINQTLRRWPCGCSRSRFRTYVLKVSCARFGMVRRQTGGSRPGLYPKESQAIPGINTLHIQCWHIHGLQFRYGWVCCMSFELATRSFFCVPISGVYIMFLCQTVRREWSRCKNTTRFCLSIWWLCYLRSWGHKGKKWSYREQYKGREMV